jgi:hypothetical protein
MKQATVLHKSLVDAPLPPQGLPAGAAPESRGCFATQATENPCQVFLMGEAAREGDLRNCVIGLGKQTPRTLDTGSH